MFFQRKKEGEEIWKNAKNETSFCRRDKGILGNLPNLFEFFSPE